MAIDTTSPKTRRAILLGTLGAVAASVAATVGHAAPASATDGQIVKVGKTYSATRATVIHASAADAIVGSSDVGAGVWGSSDSLYGLYGFSGAGTGVYGDSLNGPGVHGTSIIGNGVVGHSEDVDGVVGTSTIRHGVAGHGPTGVLGRGLSGVLGVSLGGLTGVQGWSADIDVEQPQGPLDKTGVHGYANQDGDAVGVRGESPTGRGGQFSSDTAQLSLLPSKLDTHPKEGQAGDLFVDDSHRLWFCNGGTTWKQLA